MLGGLAGLGLGVVDGLLFFALTRTLFHPTPANTEHYRRVSGWTCAVVGALALLPSWTPKNFPDPFGIAPWGAVSRLSGWENFFVSNVYVDHLIAILSTVVGPLVVAFWAMCYSGRKVAGQYVQEVEEAIHSGGVSSTGERPIRMVKVKEFRLRRPRP